MAYTEQGTIVQVLPLQQGVSKAGKEWSKQEYILETDGQYPRKVAFTLWGDKVHACSMSVGEIVVVHLEAESREYKGRWYTEVKGYKIERIGMAGATPTQASYQQMQAGASPAPQGQQPPFGNYQTMPQQGATMQAPPNDLPF